MGQGIEHQPTSQDEELIKHLDCNEAKKDCQAFSRKVLYRTRLGILLLLLLLLLLIAVIGLAAALGALSVQKLSSVSGEIVFYSSCPDGWIGYLGKCYYFSEDEVDWLSSLRNCSSLGASLSVIETNQEMGFLLRYKGPIYHWIGLRKYEEKLWEWENGRIFNNTLFDIVEGGDCAYLNDAAVMSSWCKTKKNWICSKPNAYARQKKQAEE